MCGIVGYIGNRPTSEVLLDGLQRLEYRGYDSAGIAVSTPGGHLAIAKASGKLSNLRSALHAEMPTGHAGIGHTRWATHGKPTDINAHPHTDCDGNIAVIHNGIVENHASLRQELVARGHTFRSETDTEVLPHLMEEYLRQGLDFETAALQLVKRVEGALAMVILSNHEPDKLIAARVGNAGGVVIGYGDHELFVASDLPAILPYTRRVVFLDTLQLAVLDGDTVTYRDAEGNSLGLHPETVPYDPVTASKGGYKHFLIKEIMEQPAALTDTLRTLVDLLTGDILLEGVPFSDEELRSFKRVVFLGMGTSMYAAQACAMVVERLARIPSTTENSSEFLYRNPVLGPETLVVSISQSGETVDTLAAMEEARRLGARQITICNVPSAQSTRIADGVILLRCGLEVSVASTKTFTASVLAGYVLALRLALARGTMSPSDVAERVRELARVPNWVSQALENHAAIEQMAHSLYRYSDFLYLGRGMSYFPALEGALKLKEVSYIHAEGYPAGEMKHGPIALIDENLPVVVFALRDELYAKTSSNIEQVKARGATVLAIGTEGDEDLARRADHAVLLPAVPELLSPLVAVIPVQLLAYEIALRRGCDVDQPRNLAKTVTVE